MGQADIVGSTISNHFVGTTSVSNPILFLEVNGTPVASSYVIQRVGESVRFIFAKLVGNDIYIMAMGQTYAVGLPSVTFTATVYVAE